MSARRRPVGQGSHQAEEFCPEVFEDVRVDVEVGLGQVQSGLVDILRLALGQADDPVHRAVRSAELVAEGVVTEQAVRLAPQVGEFGHRQVGQVGEFGGGIELHQLVQPGQQGAHRLLVAADLRGSPGQFLAERLRLGRVDPGEDLLGHPPQRGVALLDVDDVPSGPRSEARLEPSHQVALARALLALDEEQPRLVRVDRPGEGVQDVVLGHLGGLVAAQFAADRQRLVDGPEQGVGPRVVHLQAAHVDLGREVDRGPAPADAVGAHRPPRLTGVVSQTTVVTSTVGGPVGPQPERAAARVTSLVHGQESVRLELEQRDGQSAGKHRMISLGKRVVTGLQRAAVQDRHRGRAPRDEVAHVVVAWRHRGQSPEQGLAGVGDQPFPAHRPGQAEIGRPAAQGLPLLLVRDRPVVLALRAEGFRLPGGETAAAAPGGGFEGVERVQRPPGRVQQDHGLDEVPDPV